MSTRRWDGPTVAWSFRYRGTSKARPMAIYIATSSSASEARSSLLSFFRFPMIVTSHHTLEPYQLMLSKTMIDRYQYSALRNTIILYWFLSIATAFNTLHHLTRSYCIDFYTSHRIELCATHTTYSDSWRCGQLKTGYCTYVLYCISL